MPPKYELVKFAYVCFIQNKKEVIVPVTWIKKLNAHNKQDFDRYKLYRIKTNDETDNYDEGYILMLAENEEEIYERKQNGPRFSRPSLKILKCVSHETFPEESQSSDDISPIEKGITDRQRAAFLAKRQLFTRESEYDKQGDPNNNESFDESQSYNNASISTNIQTRKKKDFSESHFNSTNSPNTKHTISQRSVQQVTKPSKTRRKLDFSKPSSSVTSSSGNGYREPIICNSLNQKQNANYTSFELPFISKNLLSYSSFIHGKENSLTEANVNYETSQSKRPKPNFTGNHFVPSSENVENEMDLVHNNSTALSKYVIPRLFSSQYSTVSSDEYSDRRFSARISQLHDGNLDNMTKRKEVTSLTSFLPETSRQIIPPSLSTFSVGNPYTNLTQRRSTLDNEINEQVTHCSSPSRMPNLSFSSCINPDIRFTYAREHVSDNLINNATIVHDSLSTRPSPVTPMPSHFAVGNTNERLTPRHPPRNIDAYDGLTNNEISVYRTPSTRPRSVTPMPSPFALGNPDDRFTPRKVPRNTDAQNRLTNNQKTVFSAPSTRSRSVTPMPSPFALGNPDDRFTPRKVPRNTDAQNRLINNQTTVFSTPSTRSRSVTPMSSPCAFGNPDDRFTPRKVPRNIDAQNRLGNNQIIAYGTPSATTRSITPMPSPFMVGNPNERLTPRGIQEKIHATGGVINKPTSTHNPPSRIPNQTIAQSIDASAPFYSWNNDTLEDHIAEDQLSTYGLQLDAPRHPFMQNMFQQNDLINSSSFQQNGPRINRGLEMQFPYNSTTLTVLNQNLRVNFNHPAQNLSANYTDGFEQNVEEFEDNITDDFDYSPGQHENPNMQNNDRENEIIPNANVERPPQHAVYEIIEDGDKKKIHLGNNIYIDYDVWDIVSNEKKDSVFVKRLLVAIYGIRKILTRCFNADKLTYRRVTGIDSPVKEYTPKKLQVLERCFKDRLTKKKISGFRLQKSMSLMNTYIRGKRQDELRTYYQNLRERD